MDKVEVSGLYVNRAKDNLMNEILQGCTEVDKKEQEKRKKEQKERESKEFVSEIVGDMKKFSKKYEEQDISVETEGASEDISVENTFIA